MKTIKVLSETTRSINSRFFQALQHLMDEGKIASLEAFCKENGLSRPKYSEFRKDYIPGQDEPSQSRYKILDYEAVHSLVTRYKISAEWLITGFGPMIKKRADKKEE